MYGPIFLRIEVFHQKLEGRTDSEDFGVIERVIVGLVGLGPAFPV